MNSSRFQIGNYKVLAVQVLPDTYGTFNYFICQGERAVLIDAGEAKPIFQTLEDEHLHLLKILITHNHPDHAGGCREIQDRLGVQAVSPGVESGEFPILGTPCRSIATPGHLAVCKSYYFPSLGILFPGDTVIGGGCGRLMGGTAEQYFNSLQIIKALPSETRIFGGHDYLVNNMEFALSVEPDNADMQARLDLYRTDPASAIFSTLAEEKKTNPFLRVNTAEEFAALRKQKDSF